MILILLQLKKTQEALQITALFFTLYQVIYITLFYIPVFGRTEKFFVNKSNYFFGHVMDMLG